MVSVLTTNNPYNRDNRAPAPAVHEDGTNYPWRMFFDNDQRIVDADSTEELLDYLIPNYLYLTPEQKYEERIRLARSVQRLAQATIITNISPAQQDSLKEWEWTVLTSGDEDHPDVFGWGDGTGELWNQNPEVPDYWSSPVQLVLLSTSYAPETEILPPLSSEGDYVEVRNLIWLRPENEEDFLRSLSNIGFITFGTPQAVYNAKL